MDNDCGAVEVDDGSGDELGVDVVGDEIEEDDNVGDDAVEPIGREVVVGGGGAHLLVLSQSHGTEQLVKQFRSGTSSAYSLLR